MTKRSSPGFTLVELAVVMLLTVLVAGAGFYAITGFFGIQEGTQVSEDLREIEMAQKKAVINQLFFPPTATGYNAGASWLTITSLRANGLLRSNLTIDSLQGVVSTTTIPPTYSWDGNSIRFPNAAKNPLKADSGDGLYDVGPEN